MKKKYITPTEAAKLLGLTKATIYTYIKDGMLPKYRLRKTLVLDRKDVENLNVPVQVD